jgi:hypothetical protein
MPLSRVTGKGASWVLTATVTTTSADDDCGGWVVRVVSRVEDAAEGVDGLALEAESDVGVDAGGDADVEEFALAEAGAQGEFVQGVKPVAVGRMEELPGFGGGEGLETPGAVRGRLDVLGDVARKLVLGQRREPLSAALADDAAGSPDGVPFLGAALAGGAESVEEGAHVAGGEPGELLGTEAGLTDFGSSG